jgi:hypothetical protein
MTNAMLMWWWLLSVCFRQIEGFIHDVTMLLQNCRAYNVVGSEIVKQAQNIEGTNEECESCVCVRFEVFQHVIYLRITAILTAEIRGHPVPLLYSPAVTALGDVGENKNDGKDDTEEGAECGETSPVVIFYPYISVFTTVAYFGSQEVMGVEAPEADHEDNEPQASAGKYVDRSTADGILKQYQ